MVCTANDLQEWKDFPKGLRVLLLNEDHSSAAEKRSKLEAMDYHVTTFCNETEALLEFSSNPESFHVAIVEVNTSNGDWGFDFLQNAKDLPIIMTSNIHCLSTIMKCIALGAVEFLPKPLSEDKLKNIWQHVVHKAFNAGGNVITESLKPVNESLVSMVKPKLEKEEPTCNIAVETENISWIDERYHESAGDEYPAPSTPQIKWGSRLLDDGDCQDQMNCVSEKESGMNGSESKSVETTCPNPVDGTGKISEPDIPRKTVIKEEELSGRSKTDNNIARHPHNRGSDIGLAAESLSKASNLNNSCKSSRKTMKVDWTPELHKKFVQAVEQLGVDQAIPSRILELMKTEGLTRHNVASHLQKYRMHNRHILPKEDDRRLPHPRDSVQSYYPMAFPPYQYNNSLSMPPVYPMWEKPGSHPAGVPMWGQPGYPPWQPSENWHWNPYPGVQADAWGCPVMPPPSGGYPFYSQNAPGFPNAGVFDHGHSVPHNSFDLHPAEEVVDKVVKEAISKPWLPLPLGLKPPSIEGVIAELSREGICNIPPQFNGSKNRANGPGPMIPSQITSLNGALQQHLARNKPRCESTSDCT